MSPPRAIAVTRPWLDFWLLGGASLVAWAVVVAADLGRPASPPLNDAFLRVGVVFAALSFVCNFPHFMVSYRFAYGRGAAFVARHWFALVAVPGALAATLLWAALAGRAASELGLGLALRLMYLTVGWHYAKQVFGCVMVGAHFHAYIVEPWQRDVLKASVFSVAVAQLFITLPIDPSGVGWGHQLLLAALACEGVCLALVLGVFVRNYVVRRQVPSANMLVAWVAFHFWWTPFVGQREYTALMVPFFHSLQYLPFAWRMEVGRSDGASLAVAARALALVGAGYLAFQWVPSHLDAALDDSAMRMPGFFLRAIPVFINVHHFFIDSAVWRFDQREVRDRLLDA